MINEEQVTEAIYAAIDSVNETLPAEKHIKKALDTVLFDIDGYVDSLGLTILVVAIERKVDEMFNQSINLMNEQPMATSTGPFSNVKNLIDHVKVLLEE